MSLAILIKFINPKYKFVFSPKRLHNNYGYCRAI